MMAPQYAYRTPIYRIQDRRNRVNGPPERRVYGRLFLGALSLGIGIGIRQQRKEVTCVATYLTVQCILFG